MEAVSLRSTDVVALYWPHQNEVSATVILDALLAQGTKCALPVMEEGARILRFAQWKSGEPLRESRYKIKEPVVTSSEQYVEPDIIIVPLIAFDKSGHRLGYGGGYYDATLRDLRCRKDVLAVGIAFQEQLSQTSFPYEAHDQPLDLVITPENVYRFEK